MRFLPYLALGAVCCFAGSMLGEILPGEWSIYYLLALIFSWLGLFIVKHEKVWNIIPFISLAIVVGLLFEKTGQGVLFWASPLTAFCLGLVFWKKIPGRSSPSSGWVVLSGLFFCGMVAGWILDWVGALYAILAAAWLFSGIGYTLTACFLVSCRSRPEGFEQNPLAFSSDFFLLSTNIIWLAARFISLGIL